MESRGFPGLKEISFIDIIPGLPFVTKTISFFIEANIFFFFLPIQFSSFLALLSKHCKIFFLILIFIFFSYTQNLSRFVNFVAT